MKSTIAAITSQLLLLAAASGLFGWTWNGGGSTSAPFANWQCPSGVTFIQVKNASGSVLGQIDCTAAAGSFQLSTPNGSGDFGVTGAASITLRTNGVQRGQIGSTGLLTYDGGVIAAAGGLKVNAGGNGTQLNNLLFASSAQAQGAIAANFCADSAAITVTGAAAGDPCFISAGSTGYGTGIIASCYANGANQAIVHYCNVGTAANTPTANTYKLWLLH